MNLHGEVNVMKLTVKVVGNDSGLRQILATPEL